MRIAVVTGGSGYIGRFLIRRFLETDRFDRLFNYDLRAYPFDDRRVVYRNVDVRRPIDEEIGGMDTGASWLFHLAALCREPGSRPHEYFETNVRGSENVCAFAERAGFRNQFFTSTMSSYGRMEEPTPESALQCPETPYGISKAIAERVHRGWLEGETERRLILCRPGVIFGPEDRENVHRLIRAVKKGYFVFPGDPGIVKAYGYIYGLLDSVEFVTAKPDRLIVYNYAEEACLPLGDMVAAIGAFLGKRPRVVRLPSAPLIALADTIQAFSRAGGKPSPIHPVRVRKAAFPTNMKPQYLLDAGFRFRYPLERALQDWRERSPGDL